jgi:hypothetical protein
MLRYFTSLLLVLSVGPNALTAQVANKPPVAKVAKNSSKDKYLAYLIGVVVVGFVMLAMWLLSHAGDLNP